MLFFTVTVDTEEEWDWRIGCPRQPGELTNILDGLLPFHFFCKSLNAKVTYFTNYSVLDNPKASQVISLLARDSNAEIGLHIHPWNTPPYEELGMTESEASFLHNLPKRLAIKKLEYVWNAFRKIDITPTSFRGGRYSTAPWIQNWLGERGVIADASILPFTTWKDTGAPDYRKRDLSPQRVITDTGERHLWEIPLSLSFTRNPEWFWRRFYDIASRNPWKFFRLVAICEKLVCKRIWLNLENPLCDEIPILIKRLKQRSISHLNFTLHSSSLVVGKSPYTQSERDLNRLRERLDSSIKLLREYPEYKPATVSEVAHQLEKQFINSIRD